MQRQACNCTVEDRALIELSVLCDSEALAATEPLRPTPSEL